MDTATGRASPDSSVRFEDQFTNIHLADTGALRQRFASVSGQRDGNKKSLPEL
jgi:hypothetical protein